MKNYYLTFIFVLGFMITGFGEINAFTLNRQIIQSGIIKDCTIGVIDDGDTLDLFCGEEIIPNVRLLGINAPDFNRQNNFRHCYYNESKSALYGLKEHKMKAIFYGRDLCKDGNKGCRNLVQLIDIDTGVDINKLLITRGFAVSWIQFSAVPLNLRLDYLKAEQTSKNTVSGLWAKCSVKYNANAYMDSGIPSKMTD